MKMRESCVLKKLRAGRVVSCFKINLADPRVTEIAALCGFDCMWLDMEHVPTDWATIENQIRSAKIYDVDTLVRVSCGSYSDLVKPLEADASGIMVPHVMSYEDAKKIVWQTRFHPIGRRPVDGGNADAKYCMVDMKEYMEIANEQRFVGIQIEDPEPLDELEEIAQLEGIDMLFFGPGDFSQGIGAPGRIDHPLVIEARQKVAEMAKAHNKVAGTAGNIDNCQELVEMGYQFISLGADVIGLAEYCKKIITSFDNSHAKSQRRQGHAKKET